MLEMEEKVSVERGTGSAWKHLTLESMTQQMHPYTPSSSVVHVVEEREEESQEKNLVINLRWKPRPPIYMMTFV